MKNTDESKPKDQQPSGDVEKAADDYATPFGYQARVRNLQKQAFIEGAKWANTQPIKEDTPASDMTVEEFYSGFNLDFMTEEERQTIYTATELYAKGKLRLVKVKEDTPNTGDSL